MMAARPSFHTEKFCCQVNAQCTQFLFYHAFVLVHNYVLCLVLGLRISDVGVLVNISLFSLVMDRITVHGMLRRLVALGLKMLK